MSPIIGARGGLSASAYGLFSVSAALNSYESIATVTVGSGGSSSVGFSSIPSTYKHLQLRIFGRGLSSSADRVSITIKVNSDTGTNYANHALIGTGSAATASQATSQGVGANNYMGGIAAIVGSTGASNTFGASIVDILDYSSTSKYKTFRSLAGQDQNSTSGRIALVSGLWQNTAAITTLDLNLESGSWGQYSHIALYGIKG
jgi:hypothetical protein